MGGQATCLRRRKRLLARGKGCGRVARYGGGFISTPEHSQHLSPESARYSHWPWNSPPRPEKHRTGGAARVQLQRRKFNVATVGSSRK